MTPAQRKQIDAAFQPLEPTVGAEAAKAVIRSAAHGLSEVIAIECPPGRHRNKALQLVEAACLWACQGVDTTPTPAVPDAAAAPDATA